MYFLSCLQNVPGPGGRFSLHPWTIPGQSSFLTASWLEFYAAKIPSIWDRTMSNALSPAMFNLLGCELQSLSRCGVSVASPHGSHASHEYSSSAASCRAHFTRRLPSTTQFVDRTTLNGACCGTEFASDHDDEAHWNRLSAGHGKLATHLRSFVSLEYCKHVGNHRTDFANLRHDGRD